MTSVFFILISTPKSKGGGRNLRLCCKPKQVGMNKNVGNCLTQPSSSPKTASSFRVICHSTFLIPSPSLKMGQWVAQLGKETPRVQPISNSGGDACWVRASECHSPPPSHPAQNIWNAFPNFGKHSLPAFLACPPLPRRLKCLLSDTGTRGRGSMLPGYLGGWHPPASLGTVPGKVSCTFNFFSLFTRQHPRSAGRTADRCAQLCHGYCWTVEPVPLGAVGFLSIQMWEFILGP